MLVPSVGHVSRPSPDVVLDPTTLSDGRASRRGPAARSVQPRSGTRWTRPARRLIVPIALIALWQIVASAGLIDVNNYSSPARVVGTFWELSSDGTLWVDLGASLQRAGLGLLLGLSVGLALGVLAGLTRLGEDAVDATLQMLRTIPFLPLPSLYVGSWSQWASDERRPVEVDLVQE